MKNYKYYISELNSECWEKALEASDILVKMSTVNNLREKIVDSLADILKHSNSNNSVNATALALKEIGGKKSFKAILKAIKNPKNHTNISTLVYALEDFDCREHFLEIFSLFILSKKADVMLSAFNILNEQEFNIKKKYLNIAKNILNNAILSIEDRSTAEEIISFFKTQVQ